MSAKNHSAFPWLEHNDDGSHHMQHVGMSMRDYFAAQAAPTIYARLIADLRVSGGMVDNAYEITAKAAYELADAMLKAGAVSDTAMLEGQ